MAYNIEIKNVGKEPELFKVFGRNDLRRSASFQNYQDAREAMRIILMLRTDSAFEYAKVIKE